MIGRIHHLGYVVRDLRSAVAFYEEVFGMRHLQTEMSEEQGVLAARLQAGDVELELLQPTNPDSPVGRFLARRGEGMHHVAYLVPNLERALEELESREFELVDRQPRVGLGGRRIAFLHPQSAFGVLTELVEERGE
ncbi:methylmalonyl-CoA epimerase [Rubrobacter calidifluminis]|uniref:methylmalonyl-CoA epimerase n=1 Tax=Rubrobacter calidifluminis TaxID=1392640 RepID=UPI00235FB2D4|nr:methylmalonyl-CoA epimerase [Rubrobacter calidifluminis]